MWLIIIAVLVSCLATIYSWARHQNNFWQRTKVPYLPGIPFVGNYWPLIAGQQSVAELYNKLYSDPRVKDEPLFGAQILHQPVIFVRHPELIKQILIADFDTFSNRYMHSDVHDPMGDYNLLTARNPFWRKIRKRLTPLFTGSRLRNMFGLIDEVGTNLNAAMLKMAIPTAADGSCSGDGGDGGQVVDVKEVVTCFTTDVIASCAYGLRSNCLDDNNSEFRTQGRNVFATHLWRMLETTFVYFLPQYMRTFNMTVFGEDVSNFARKTFAFAMGERERTKQVRHDLIDTLLELKQEDRDRVLEDKDDVRKFRKNC